MNGTDGRPIAETGEPRNAPLASNFSPSGFPESPDTRLRPIKRTGTPEIHPWTFSPRNPVVTPGRLNGPHDDQIVGSAMVLIANDRYRMYYWARDHNGHNTICAAEASLHSAHDWRGTGVALERQPDNPHNNVGPAAPMVVPVSDQRWLMYVVAKGVIQRRGYLNDVILAAESLDGGYTWKYIGDEPLLARDRVYDQHGTASLFVQYSGDVFRMWYTAFQYRGRDEASWLARATHGITPAHVPYLGIAYAESSDGITWHKPHNRLVVAPRDDRVDPVEHWVAKPWVLQTAPDEYRMWVSCIGATYKVHALTSRDGLSWEWDDPSGTPDLRDPGGNGVGSPGQFDDMMRGYTCVLLRDGELQCWYTGNGYGSGGMGYASRELK